MTRRRMIRWEMAVTPKQRRYLAARAKAAGLSMAAIVRALIDTDIWQTNSVDTEGTENDEPVIPVAIRNAKEAYHANSEEETE